MAHIIDSGPEALEEPFYDPAHYDDRYPQGAAFEVEAGDPREFTAAEDARYREALHALSNVESLEQS